MPAQLKRRLTVFLVAVGLIALAFFLHWWFIGRHVESTDNAYVQGEITRVASQLGARVEEVLVRDNQHVDKGQLLVRLEDADFKLAVERAQAALATREAELAQARSKLVQQGSLIAASAADGSMERQMAIAISRLNTRFFIWDLLFGRTCRYYSHYTVGRLGKTGAGVKCAKVGANRKITIIFT